MLLGLHFRPPEQLKAQLENQSTVQNDESLSAKECEYLVSLSQFIEDYACEPVPLLCFPAAAI